MRWLAALGLALALVGVPVGLAATAALTGSGTPTARPAVAIVQQDQPTLAAPQPGDHAPYPSLPAVGSSDEPTTESTGPAEPAPTPRPKPAVPVRLIVPELGVRAPVVPITAPGGVLLPPGDPQVLGWWLDGARPGARNGGALITGHTVHTGGGAFDNLETLSRGDAIKVRTHRGLIEYVVTHVRIYPKSSLARHAGQVFSQDVPGRLVLITCEGWNGVGYDSNAVVLARPI